ncbi:RecX family transcriptional regulator [Terrilactibacillus laevilacticus]|uniref:Regulatory protein RecX n=1 Tax=Terrilactibacillus laevilacticus TaxID=1380157 RepID=A0ABW5PUS3_9BACI|nr:RecX family transcriptional regulator [Terrilactibacillus laevilacticus]
MYSVNKIEYEENEKGVYKVDIKNDSESDTILVHEDVLVRFALRKGMQLSLQMLEQLKHAQQDIKCYHAAIYYLSFRMRSTQETRDYLYKKMFETHQIESAIKRLTKENVLNDQAFADMFIKNRIQLSNKGPELIKRELDKLGISQEIVEQSIQAYSRSDQIKNARSYIEKKANQGSKRHSAKEYKNKLTQKLMQRGYSHSIIKEVLQDVIYSNYKLEQEAIYFQGQKAMKKYRNYEGKEWEYKVKSYLYRKGFSLEDINAFLQSYIGE